MCLDGYGQVEVDGDKPVRFSKGETVFASWDRQMFDYRGYLGIED